MGSDKPATINLNVPPSAMTALRDYCERTSRTQRDVLAKVLLWFVGQPGSVQRVVMGDVEDMQAEHAAALRKLADELASGNLPTVKHKPNRSNHTSGSPSAVH